MRVIPSRSRLASRLRSRLRSRSCTRSRDEAGAVAVVVAAFSVAMFGFAAIVVDLGQARDLRVQMQTTADAAALAATNAVYAAGTPVPDLSGAVAVAKTYAADNLGVTAAQWSSCTDSGRPAGYANQPGETPCISFSPNLTRPGRVRVALPTRSVTTAFSGALGLSPPPVGAAAEADVRIDGRVPCALCVLGTGTHSIGNGDVVVYGGDIHVNGNISLGSNGITAASGAIVVQGSVTGGHYSPAPRSGPLMVDPLLKYPMPQPPTYGGLPTTPKTDPCSQGPGIYGSWSMSGSGSCTLSPGLYVVAGGSTAGWTLSGSGTVLGTGVTLYFTCGTPTVPRNCAPNEPTPGAFLDGSGSVTVKLAAPTSGDLQGYTVIYDRNNTADYRMAGNAQSTIVGTLYMPRGRAVMTGNGCVTSHSVLTVVGDIAPSGDNACLTMTYDPTKAAQSPADNLRLTK